VLWLVLAEGRRGRLELSPCAMHRRVEPRAARLHPSGCSQRFPPPCAAHRLVEPSADLSQPSGCSQRFPPPCAMQSFVPRCISLVHSGCSQRRPPPCFTQRIVCLSCAFFWQPSGCWQSQLGIVTGSSLYCARRPAPTACGHYTCWADAVSFADVRGHFPQTRCAVKFT